jgi:hypothetical protein
MSKEPKYVPIFRGRQQEFEVLKSFDFGKRIYPCIEIIKELDRLPPKPRKGAKKPAVPKPTKKFEEVYLPLIQNLTAEKVFVDLPVHLSTRKNMVDVTLDFLQTVVGNRKTRTSYMKKFESLASKVIPVISTYYGRTGEANSITLQANDLRTSFGILAFRTFPESFHRDILQIESILTKKDYVIMDWEDTLLDRSDEEQTVIIEKLLTLKCNIIIHRNAVPKEMTNVSLIHTRVIDRIDNSLLDKYKDFSGQGFSDYSGIKKDEINKGGAVSPGFIYYDAVNNQFYGYKSDVKKLSEFETTIVPAVISSAATTRMNTHALDYLGTANIGWGIIQRIHRREEPGGSAGKFKRIGMEHYLHCMKTRISNGDFD